MERHMSDEKEPRDAMLWESLEGGFVRCGLCAHRCRIQEWDSGICGVRHNAGGTLKTLNYDHIVAMNIDPIEKKPLFHYLPGTKSLSIAAPGCNFTCLFCQNWNISQSPRENSPLGGKAVPPEKLVETAIAGGCRSISYTYSEPTVFFELAYDTACLASGEGLGNCFVSNGFMTPEAVEQISPYLDAINVDLKCFSDETYREVTGGRLQPVLDCLEKLVGAGVWVEVTTLVVPGMNDSPDELRQIAEFIADRLGAGVPWHVSRFHGDYKMSTRLPTQVESLQLACSVGSEAGLKYVYCGNVHGLVDERTVCHNCGAVLVDRKGFSVGGLHLLNGTCPDCGMKIEGKWE
jgi:pyruvate formate lyase activating enzyme